MPDHGDLRLLTGTSNRPLVEGIAKILETEIVPAEVGKFRDGEVLVKILEGETGNVRDRDVFIVQSTNAPAENVLELLLLIDAAKRASAGRVTVVVPYFGYGCQERKDRPRAPISALVMAKIISLGLEAPDRVCLFDLHAAAIQGFFPIPRVDHIFLRRVLLEDVLSRFAGEDTTVIAPDTGGAKAARAFAKRIGKRIAILDKVREPITGKITIEDVVGIDRVKGRHALLFDDMVRGSDTVVLGSEKLREVGATGVTIYASHALLVNDGPDRIAAAPIDRLIVTDSVFISSEKREKLGNKLVVISIAPFVAEAIRRIHNSESVSSMFELPAE